MKPLRLNILHHKVPPNLAQLFQTHLQPRNTTSLVAKKVCDTAVAAISYATFFCCRLSPGRDPSRISMFSASDGVRFCFYHHFIWVFPKIVVPPNHPFVHRVFHYFHHPFWGTTIFGNTHILSILKWPNCAFKISQAGREFASFCWRVDSRLVEDSENLSINEVESIEWKYQ